MKSLKDFFKECLEKSAEHQPVILVLDSLDQLSLDDSGRQMDWYPRQLPRNVYAILSTLPGEEYQTLPSLRVSLKSQSLRYAGIVCKTHAGNLACRFLTASNHVLVCSLGTDSMFLLGAVDARWPHAWLVRSSPDRALHVRIPAADTVSCSWARHFTLTVPLSTQVYKWVPANMMPGITLRLTSLQYRGE